MHFLTNKHSMTFKEKETITKEKERKQSKIKQINQLNFSMVGTLSEESKSLQTTILLFVFDPKIHLY